MLRSFIAVVTGFLFTGIGIITTTNAIHGALPAIFPAAPGRLERFDALMIDLGVIALFAIAGCWLAARLAPARPMRHALILGAIAFAMGVPNTIQAWEQAPAWYNLLNLALVMPFAIAGGWLRTLQVGEA